MRCLSRFSAKFGSNGSVLRAVINMAEACVEEVSEHIQTPESGLKCRQCRSGFVAELYDCDGEFTTTDDLFVFDDDSMPDWIAVKVEEVLGHLVTDCLMCCYVLFFSSFFLGLTFDSLDVLCNQVLQMHCQLSCHQFPTQYQISVTVF